MVSGFFGISFVPDSYIKPPLNYFDIDVFVGRDPSVEGILVPSNVIV
jgi:hypothetical protein